MSASRMFEPFIYKRASYEKFRFVSVFGAFVGGNVMH